LVSSSCPIGKFINHNGFFKSSFRPGAPSLCRGCEKSKALFLFVQLAVLPASDASASSTCWWYQDEEQVHFYFPEIVRGLGFGWPSCAHLLLAYFGHDKSTIAFFFLYEDGSV
jgi:hypothetical protein